jgi:hypothetical protein
MALAAVYLVLAYRFFFRAGPPRLAPVEGEPPAAGTASPNL